MHTQNVNFWNIRNLEAEEDVMRTQKSFHEDSKRVGIWMCVSTEDQVKGVNNQSALTQQPTGGE